MKTLWPLGKFPVLRDDARNRTVPEASIIIEHLAQHYPGKNRLVPADPDLATQARLRDRVYDLYGEHADREDRHRPAAGRPARATHAASRRRGRCCAPPAT